MRATDRLVARYVPGFEMLLLLAFAVALWLGGGASRADVAGQVVVRAVAWTCLALIVLFGERAAISRGRAMLWFLLAGIILAAVQLVPLPPGLWAALPGREAFAPAADIVGNPAPWRPMSISPSATWNALGAMIVPFATWGISTRLRGIKDEHLLKVLLGMIVASMVIALGQFAGVPLHDPLVNGGGEVSGTFANHNHFALFMACGLLFVPVWAFRDTRLPAWRAAVALGLILLLALTILGSGSRAGTLVGVIALAGGLLMVRQPLRQALRRYPRWAFPALVLAIVGVVLGLVALSVLADRALSINRAMTLDVGQDMRSRGLPTVLALVRDYFPAGAGLGTFDTAFRIREPFELLKPTYFNRAHDDLIEIVLDAGLMGVLLLVAGLLWWLRASFRAWRSGSGAPYGRMGSILLLIILVASVVDYPVRTPIIMMVAVIAGVWLGDAGRQARALALPKTNPPL